MRGELSGAIVRGGLRQVLASVMAFALVWLGGSVVLAATAAAAPAEILASEEDFVFVGDPFEQPQGEVATFVNPVGSPALHNVYALNRGPDNRALFSSETISPGSEAAVDGTQYLGPGLYEFVCTLHPGMEASLRITTAGTPESRPVVRVAIPGQRLSSIVRQRKFRVTVKSPTGVDGARVAVKLGSKVLGRSGSLRVAQGGKRGVSVRLSAKGVKALKGKRSVAIKATASVEFGKSSTDRRVFR